MEYYMGQKVLIVTKDGFVVRGLLNNVTPGEIFLADYRMSQLNHLAENVCKGSGDDYLIIPKFSVISLCRSD